MKKLTLMMFATFSVVAAIAQIEKGTFLISGSSNFGYNNLSPDNSSGYTLMNLNLKGGYFPINNLSVGVTAGLLKNDDYSETTLGAFARYYFFGKLFAGAGFSSLTPDEGDATTEIPVEIGYAVFVANNFAVEPSLGYTMGDGYEKFGLNIGLTLYPGR
jgi:hypothetical protein